MRESKDTTLNIYTKVDIDQLDYCNAFVRSCYLNIDGSLVLAKRELVSYCTPVLGISYNTDGNIIHVTCAPAATCSVTTRKHVGRFLHKYCDALSYYDIKHALTTPNQQYRNGLRVIDLKTMEVSELPDNMHVYNVLYESVKPFSQWY